MLVTLKKIARYPLNLALVSYFKLRFLKYRSNGISFSRAPGKLKAKISGRKNYITFSFLREGSVTISGSGNHFSFEKNTSINNLEINCTGHTNKVTIGNGSNIQKVFINIIGNNNILKIDQSCFVRDGEFWLYGNNCSILLGESTTIEKAHFAATEEGTSIQIGKDCMFSTDVEVRTGDSHVIMDAQTQERLNTPKDIQIEDHVWVGARSSILKGVRIGKNSVIGTGAVVTHEIPEGSVAAGVPAKILKKAVMWHR